MPKTVYTVELLPLGPTTCKCIHLQEPTVPVGRQPYRLQHRLDPTRVEQSHGLPLRQPQIGSLADHCRHCPAFLCLGEQRYTSQCWVTHSSAPGRDPCSSMPDTIIHCECCGLVVHEYCIVHPSDKQVSWSVSRSAPVTRITDHYYFANLRHMAKCFQAVHSYRLPHQVQVLLGHGCLQEVCNIILHHTVCFARGNIFDQMMITLMRFPLPPAKNTTLTEPSGTVPRLCDSKTIGLCTWHFLACQLLSSPTVVPARALQVCSVLCNLTPSCVGRLDLPDRK